MDAVLSIKDAQRRSLNQSTKENLGFLVSRFARQKTRQLFASPISQPVSASDKLIMAYLKRRAMQTGQEQFFERLHAAFWQGVGGAAFAENCDHRFEDLFLGRQQPDFLRLREQWDQYRPEHIVELGCNSGLLLSYLTTELPDVASAIGIEINADQVRRNQDSNRFDPRIDFVCADGADWLFENGRANTLFVSNGGVLEYFWRDRLDAMLTHISTHLRPALFFAVEPVAEDHDWNQTRRSIPFGEELSFSHNYSDLFESNGFAITHQRAVNHDSWKMVATIAVCV